MEKKLEIIRGARIIQQMEKLDEATYAELERETMRFVPASTKRQWAVNPVQVTKLDLDAARPSETLRVRATINSNGNKYDSIVQFSNVIYEDEDQPDNITLTASDGQTYNIIPIKLSQHTCRVRCTCLDFRWRFSPWNEQKGSLYGDGPPPYQKRTDRAPVNPRRTPGVCKHIMKTVIALKDAGIVTV